MRTSTLLSRSLLYFWRTNVAVVIGVATAVAVLAGALLVGDSVRGSLRDLLLRRLGKTDYVVSSAGFFRERLVEELESDDLLACPLIRLNGFVTHESSGRRASGVQVYGVDGRFWRFHGRETDANTPGERDIFLSPDLARELGSEPGQAILLRVEKPSAIPAGSLHGRKDDLGRTIRLTAREAAALGALAEFSIRPHQGAVRAVFVSLGRLQKDLGRPGKINTILLSDKIRTRGEDETERTAKRELIGGILRDRFAVEDLGIKLRVLGERRGLALESESAIISDTLFENAQAAATESKMGILPVLSYLANSIRSGRREVPYSLVTAIGSESFEILRHSDMKGHTHADEALASHASEPKLPPILLNEWAAEDLDAKPGEVIALEYYVWKEEGRLSTGTTQFRLAGVVPIKGEAADRDLVPDYPGITETDNLSDWDPPFPIDLKRVRPRDEDYWHRYRATPKAFIPLDVGQQLWQSRFGKVTSLRILPEGDPGPALEAYKANLRKELDPAESGFAIHLARSEGLQASRGATDFGEYFVYFSLFLVIAALLLASLFFKLGIEQRLREIGILRAVGYPAARVRSLFLAEGLVLAAAGSALGLIGAVAYGATMMQGLRTWWVGAVGTTLLSLHVSAASLAMGGAGGVVIALACIVWTLKGLTPASPHSLLTGNLDAATTEGHRNARTIFQSPRLFSAAFALLGLGTLVVASLNWVGQTAGFFGAGSLLVAALLCFEYGWLKRRVKRFIGGSGWWPVSRLGFRNAAHRPGRSILCIALIAGAAFIIVAVDAFRRDDSGAKGAGGFPLLAESLLPLHHDPNTAAGREALNLSPSQNFDPEKLRFTRFRVRPGDDASCLNLYQPRSPRILAPADDFLANARSRFAFQDSLARTDEERQNPWLLLNGEEPDGSIPVVADANSMTYVLHRKLGDEIAISLPDGEPIRMRVVGALHDSIFQGELLMSEKNFLRLFPHQGGYSFFLLEVVPDETGAVAGALEEQLSDFGVDVIPTAERLAGYHRVENTYLTTFQTLGGLGLVLGTLGLATVLLRNVLERRRELALLRAVGYNSKHFAWMVLTENAFLVSSGLATGTICALVAIAPALSSRGGSFPAFSLGLLAAVFVTGLAASISATIAALRAPLLPALRAE